MQLLDILFLCLMALFVMFQGAGLLQWYLRRRTLGAMLCSSNHPGREMVYAFSLVALVEIGDIVFRSKQIGPIGLTRDFLMTFLWSALAYQALFPRGLVRIHERGLTVGTLALQWSDVSGWSWSPAGEPLSVTRSARHELRIWTRSRWLILAGFRGAAGIRTGVARDEQVDTLLRKYAAEAAQ